mgnify:CR=1 FL=1
MSDLWPPCRRRIVGAGSSDNDQRQPSAPVPGDLDLTVLPLAGKTGRCDQAARRGVPGRSARAQAAAFTVAGGAAFPKALEPKMHSEVLLKNPFFPLVDVTVTIVGIAGKAWTQPIIWVNRAHMLALYLG